SRSTRSRAGSSAAARNSREPTDMTITENAPAPAPVQLAAAGPRITSAQLPSWSPWALLAGLLTISAAVFGVVAAGGAGFSIVGTLIVGILVHIVLLAVLSTLVEGRRKATDRVVTVLVTVAFGIAMIPLVSVAWTALQNGVEGLSAE